VLNSVEVTKLDRGESKSVRAVVMVTPEAWKKLSEVTALPNAREEPVSGAKESASRNKKAGAKAPARHQ